MSPGMPDLVAEAEERDSGLLDGWLSETPLVCSVCFPRKFDRLSPAFAHANLGESSCRIHAKLYSWPLISFVWRALLKAISALVERWESMHESLWKLRFSELWSISHPAITTLLWLFRNCSTTQSHLCCTEAKLCNDCKGESGVSAQAKLMNDHSRGTIGTNVSSRHCGSLDNSLKNLHQKNGSQRFNKDMWVEVTAPVFPKQD